MAHDRARLELRLRRGAAACGFGVAAVAVTVLAGWLADLPALTWLHPSFDAMRPNSAASFLLAGIALVLLPHSGDRRGRLAVLALAVTMAALNAVGLAEWGTGRDAGIDGLLVPGGAGATGSHLRTAPASAANFLLVAVADACVVLGRGRRIVPWLLLAAAVAPLLFLLQSGYGHESVRDAGENVRMSVLSGLCFLALAVGTSLSNARGAPDAALSDPGSAGILLRRIVPLAAFGTVALGWLSVDAVRIGRIDAPLAAAVFACGALAVTGAAVWLTVRRLRQVDAERQRSYRTLAALSDASPAAMALLDLDGTIRAWNTAAETLLGVPADRAIGAPLPAHATGGDGEVRARLLRGQPLQSVDVTFGHAGRDDVHLGLSSGVVADDQGRPASIVAVWIDRTHRKRAEQRLETEYERVSLMNQVTRAIAERQDPTSIYGAVLGFLVDRLAVDQCVVALPEGDAFAVAAGRGGSGPDALGTLAPGEPFDLGPRLSPLVLDGQTAYEADATRDPDPFARRVVSAGLRSVIVVPLAVGDSVDGVLLAGRAAAAAFSTGEAQFLRQLAEHVALVGHQARLHEDLRRAYESLRDSQRAVTRQERLRAMGQMASGIAHDINNSLSPIVVYAELALQRSPDLDPRTRHALEVILKAGEDVAGTVARMREFYRPRGGGDDLALLDLNLLVLQVIDLTRPRWKDMPEQHGRQVGVSTDLRFDLPRVAAVETEVRDALTNLVFNAVDAMPSGGTLTLRTLPLDAGTVAIEVVDTGTGMDEETRARCVEPFFTTKGERGTGLGLAMVFGMAQRHGGRVDIDSTPGRGTTVRLVLPVGSLVPDGADAARSPATLPGLRILVVDDDAMLRQSMLEMLSDDGHAVDVASDGPEALARFREARVAGTPYAVVVTDHGMPGMTGRELGQAIKADSPSTPVVLVTGWGALSREDSASDPAVDEIVSKPPRVKRMREALARVLAKRTQ